ncbi:hypothetical protein [Lacrimispora sp. 38-1]
MYDWEKDLEQARKRSRQSKYLSVAAFILSMIAVIIRIVVAAQL